MRFRAEPPFTHSAGERAGVLLVNIGTPAQPTSAAVRRYLGRFLSDPRVVEIPRWLWLPLLHLVILTLRAPRSAAKYASIWRHGQSPLLRHTIDQAQGLQAHLAAEFGDRVTVAYAMRYSDPDIALAMAKLRAACCTHFVIVPLYPQYAAATTASTMDEVFQFLQSTRTLPAMRWVHDFHDHPAYIQALASGVRRHWADGQARGHLLVSFHGVPRRSLDLGDPYHCHCLKTARLLAESLDLAADQWSVSFQSRFGANRWLEPYTLDVVRQLAARGVTQVDVVMPSFVSDCLETLEEIGIEVRDAFMAAGGRSFRPIPCLNSDAEWIAALASLIRPELHQWFEPAGQAALEERTKRAMALGASQ